MDTRRGTVSFAICGLLLVSISAKRFVPGDSHDPSAAHSDPDACSLLTTADASNALEVSSVPGKRLMESTPTACVWSNDPAAGDTSRKVSLVTHSLIAFKAAQNPAITTIKIESVAGIGDEAFYQIYPGDNPPFIWVRKGNNSISVRIITRKKPSPFTHEQEKAKITVLAKAAAANL